MIERERERERESKLKDDNLIDDDPIFTNTTYLPCQGNCGNLKLVEIHSESGDNEAKYIIHEDCYHQGGNSYICWKHQEEKQDSQSKSTNLSGNSTTNINPPQSQENKPQKTNWTPWILGGIGAITLISLIVYLLTRKKGTN